MLSMPREFATDILIFIIFIDFYLFFFIHSAIFFGTKTYGYRLSYITNGMCHALVRLGMNGIQGWLHYYWTRMHAYHLNKYKFIHLTHTHTQTKRT